MLYAVLCYNNEEMVCGWTKEQDDAVMAALTKAHDKWEKAGKLKPSIRLLPTSAATTLHKQSDMVIDGPYAETKEALLGFYIIDVDGLDEGLEFARDLGKANPGGAYELRPIQLYLPGGPINEAYATERDYAGDKVPAK
ncbi:MAG: YciI family protein [Hyphomonadaceae bacterium]